LVPNPFAFAGKGYCPRRIPGYVTRRVKNLTTRSFPYNDAEPDCPGTAKAKACSHLRPKAGQSRLSL
jgi:hypothetical protein